jgi:hypothetical protein
VPTKDDTMMKQNTIKALLITAIVLTAGTLFASYPAAPRPARPTPLPELPATFPLFTPPLSNNGPHASAPALAEWTRSNGPGDTLALTGSRLSAFSNEEAGRDTRFVVFAQTSFAAMSADAAIQRISGQHAAITLPLELPTPSLYMVWPKNANGFGTPALLNQTEAWWIGPDTATRQESVSVFGRNLTAGDEGTLCWIYLQAPDDSGRWLTSRAANPYKADFTVPADTDPGTYRVWVHNSLGGQYGWSGPLMLSVDEGVVWTGPEIDVTAYGAMGDGSHDDIDAIDAAIDAAGDTPGTTVIFPQGTYLISRGIHNIPDHTRLRGAGMDLTTITAHPGFTTNAYGMLFGSMERVVVADMSWDTMGRVQGVLGNNVAYIRGSSRVEFNRVRFSQLEGRDDSYIIDTHHCELITFRDCTFIIASGLFLGGGRQIFIEACDFRGVHDCNALVYEWGGSEVSIANCTAADYDNSDPSDGRGWCQGRFLAGFGRWGSMRHIYFGGNHTTDMTVRPDFHDQNTGEQFMFEALDTLYRGAALSSGEDRVRLADLAADYTDESLVIVSGPGMGQSRRIMAFDPADGSVTVDEPWRVAPTPDSIIMIGRYMSRMAVYNNTFDGKERAVTNATHIAATAIVPYGGCVDLIVARNRFQQLSGGISNWSMGEPSAADGLLTLQPNYFNIFADNTFEHCLSGIENTAIVWQDLPLIPDTAMLGTIFRGNQLNDIRDAAFTSQSWADGAAIKMCIMDQNTATDVRIGAWCGTSGLQDHVLVRNHFSGQGGDALALKSDHLPALRENTWEGFAPDYGLGAPGAVLELPQRTVTLSCALGQSAQSSLPVWNSGTAPLAWQATTASAWLDIESSGVIDDEQCAGALVLTATTTNLPPGSYQAVVTIVSAYQTRQITVTLEAGLSSDAPPPLLAFDNPATASNGSGIVQWMIDHNISTNSMADGDSDGDGITLLEEYAFNMDPAVASRDGMPRLQAGPTGGAMQYIFTRARAELGYRVERCTDLRQGAWTPVAINPGDAGTTVTLPATLEPGHTCGFFRLAITQP